MATTTKTTTTKRKKPTAKRPAKKRAKAAPKRRTPKRVATVSLSKFEGLTDLLNKVEIEAVKIAKRLIDRAEEASAELRNSIEDLVDLVFDAADSVSGLEGMDQVMLRGKSVTFDTGM